MNDPSLGERRPTRSGLLPALSGKAAAWAITLLCLLYILSYIDRVILSLLVEPLKADLGVSDVQLGLLFGAAFAIFYGVLGLPLARLADRGDRKLLIVAGVLLWSLSTIGSGFALSFGVLVLLRIGLAVGEAALSPAAYSMIADLYPPERRAFPASLYAASGMFGAYGSYVLGAGVIAVAGSEAITTAPLLSHFKVWQLVFLIVGAPGLLLAILFVLTVREPLRTAAAAQSFRPFPLPEVIRYLVQRKRLYLGLFLGAGVTNVIAFSYAGWGPELFRRNFDWPIGTAGIAFGLTGLTASASGTLILTRIADRLRRAGREDALVVTAIAATILGGILAALAPMAPSGGIALACLGGAIFALNGCTNLAIVSVQFIAPGGIRAVCIALLFMCMTTIGLGLGPPLTAWLGSKVFADAGGLAPALTTVSLLVLPISIALLWWSRPAYVEQVRSGDVD